MKRKTPPKMKDKFVVVCHLVDCKDEYTFLLDGAECCETIAEARKLMKEDFKNIWEEYSPEWSADGKTDPCTLKKYKDEIWFYIPIWDCGNKKESWIVYHWKIVKI